MIYRFDNFELDTYAGELREDGAAVAMEPKVFELLLFLASNHDRLVTRDQILEHVWNGRIVSDAALSSGIKAARGAIGDSGKSQKFIKTLHGRGFRFVVDVEVVGKQVEPRTTESHIDRRPSIAILPFTNLSGDSEQEYFADGLVDDVTTSLSRARWLFVMSRNSSFTYRGQAVDVKQVGRELNVAYLLEGSIRRAGGQIRISAQLVDTATGGHIWADRFEGGNDDVFALQDMITERVAGAIEPGLRKAETARAWAKPTEDLDAYDLYLRGVHQIYIATHAALNAAIEHLSKAAEIDPQFRLAKAYLALAYAIRHTPGWNGPQDRDFAIQLSREVIQAAEDDPTTLRTAGYALAYFADKNRDAASDDLDVATSSLKRALRLHPSSAQTLNSLGFACLWSGDVEQAIVSFQKAIRISPRDQETGYMLHGLATAHLIVGRNEEALATALRATEEMPKNSSSHRVVIVALVRLGRMEEARAATKRLLSIVPDSTLASVKPPSRISGYADGFLSDLRLAGYPA